MLPFLIISRRCVSSGITHTDVALMLFWGIFYSNFRKKLNYNFGGRFHASLVASAKKHSQRCVGAGLIVICGHTHYEIGRTQKKTLLVSIRGQFILEIEPTATRPYVTLYTRCFQIYLMDLHWSDLVLQFDQDDLFIF